MGARKTPLEQMRELADQGMEPWQIAAALGVREAAVASALRTPTGGGAAGVVERITGQSPVAAAVADVERDRQAAAAVVPPTFAAAVDEAATTLAEALDLPDGATVVFDFVQPLITPDDAAAVEFDPDDASTYPCATGGDCGCSGTGLLGCPGRDEDAVADARRALEDVLLEETTPEEDDEQALAVVPCGDPSNCAAGGDCKDYADGLPVAASLVVPEMLAPAFVEQDERAAAIRAAVIEGAGPFLAVEAAASVALDRDPDYGTHVVDGPVTVGTGQDAIPVVVDDALPADVVVLIDQHVHEPFPVADERGIFHAECECGARWDRAACDVCGLPVAALHIAKTGTARHAHHDLPTPRKD